MSRQPKFPDMTVREASAYLAEHPADAILIDVREPDEYQPRHATGAINIPMSEFVARIGEVPQDRDALIICEHGVRSANVVQYLRRHGYDRAINVDGGTEEWEAAGMPMEYPKR